MAVLRKQAKIAFHSQTGWSAVFRPVYQEHVEASRAQNGDRWRKVLENNNPGFDDYVAIGMRPIRLAAFALLGIYGIDMENDDGTMSKTDIESFDGDQAFEFVCQLCEIDKEFRDFCKALGDGQKKTSLDT